MPAALVLDNGSNTIKAGFSNDKCSQVLNSITKGRDRRLYVGNDIENCRDVSGVHFRRPIEKGQLYSWEAEKVVWDYVFDTGILGKPVDPTDTHLILSEMPYTLGSLTVNTDQICLEEYNFKEYTRLTPQAMGYWNSMAEIFDDGVANRDCALIVDSGFTATQVVPVVKGASQWPAIRRLDIGGKVLTNYLKETVSFRYYNMMDEPYILNAIKEKVCYVSNDFVQDLDKWRSSPADYTVSYLLPDALSPEHRFGKLVENTEGTRLRKQGNQVLTLGNECFSVPEILFNPTDIGLHESGIPETIAESINAAPQEVQPLLWSNIVLTGGTSLLPNYTERVAQELQSLCPQDIPLRVRRAPDPITFNWSGGAGLANNPQRKKWSVSRQDYMEHGESLCVRLFGKNPYE